MRLKARRERANAIGVARENLRRVGYWADARWLMFAGRFVIKHHEAEHPDGVLVPR